MGLLKVNPTGLQNHMFWGLVFQVQDPRTGELGGGSDHLFFGEDLCDCNYFLLCESLLDGSVGTEPACHSGRHRRRGFQLWAGENPGGGSGNLLQYSCWKILWTEEPGGPQSMGSQHDCVCGVYTHTPPRDMGLDYTMPLPLLPISLWFLLYIFNCMQFFLLAFQFT